ncbi:MAG: flagellar hook-basal body complex protein FliE [Deltaproteobacteria bacterium]
MVDQIKGAFTAPVAFGEALNKPKDSGDTFSTVLKDSIEKVNRLQLDADKAIDGLAKGDASNIHQTMIAVEEANLSFNMMLQVRNKLLAAYEEIMRMQV